jgi:2,4-dienoyl-CoA reductase-like NADH-dependent reductase (Old Yellow Enzyme family)
MSMLFSPIKLGPLELANRIAIAPMCQYSAAKAWRPTGT